MRRSTTSAATEPRRLLAILLGLALIVELVTAAALLNRPTAEAPSTPAHTMRLVDRGGQSGLPGRIAAELPGAVAAVSAFWGDDWPPEVLIVTTGSDADFAAQTGDPARNWMGVAAVAVADRVDPSRREASGQRIVFAPGAAAMSLPALRIVLRHELFHYAARAQTPLDAPLWLTEGVADYVARPADSRPAPAAVAARLPSDDELTGPEQSAAYDRAWWFARFVADEYGTAALRRLYVAAGDPQAALGVGWHDLLTRWQRWLSG